MFRKKEKEKLPFFFSSTNHVQNQNNTVPGAAVPRSDGKQSLYHHLSHHITYQNLCLSGACEDILVHRAQRRPVGVPHLLPEQKRAHVKPLQEQLGARRYQARLPSLGRFRVQEDGLQKHEVFVRSFVRSFVSFGGGGARSEKHTHTHETLKNSFFIIKKKKYEHVDRALSM